MAADWYQYINIGEFLLKNIDSVGADEEMISRCIVSRAYYAAFCVTRDAAADSHLFTITGGSEDHKNLRAILSKGHPSIANRLNELRTKRNDADYKENILFTYEDAEYCLRLAKDICEKSSWI